MYACGVGDSRYSVALIDGAGHAPRWQSQPLSKQAYQGLLVAGQDLIYLTDQDQLLALRLSDGTPAWQTALAIEPHCPQPNTFSELERPRDDTPLLFSADGKRRALWGLDAASGERAGAAAAPGARAAPGQLIRRLGLAADAEGVGASAGAARRGA